MVVDFFSINVDKFVVLSETQYTALIHLQQKLTYSYI